MTSQTPQAGLGLPEIDQDRREIIVRLDEFEWRDSGDPANKNETTIRGHAAIFNSLSEDLGGFREIIEPGFFRAALRKNPDVRLLFNHDENYVMGRTASGTLELREDNRGLHVFGTVDKTISWVSDLRKSMQRGDIDQMSFAFTLTDEGDDWAVTEDGVVIRTLRADGAKELFDTSVVTYPAYKATEVSMRSLLESAIASGRLPERGAGAETIVAPLEEEPVGDPSTSQDLPEDLGEETSAPVAEPVAEQAAEEPGEDTRAEELKALRAHTHVELELAKRRLLDAERGRKRK
jgi:HK97 family phage prohead protease